MSPHYERARTLYALWRLLTTHESGVAVVDTMMVRMGQSKESREDVVLLAARRELRMFKDDMLRLHPEHEMVAVAVMWTDPGATRGYVPESAGPVHATLRVGAGLQLEREFLEFCVDPAFPHLRRHPGPVPA